MVVVSEMQKEEEMKEAEKKPQKSHEHAQISKFLEDLKHPIITIQQIGVMKPLS